VPDPKTGQPAVRNPFFASKAAPEMHYATQDPDEENSVFQDVSIQALNALIQAGLKRKDLKTRMELDSTEALLSAVEAGLGVTFVSRWAVRNQLTLGTLKLARVRGVTFSRMFSLAYPAGPEPTGNIAAFRSFLLAHSLDLASRVAGRAMKNSTESEDSRSRSKMLTLMSDARTQPRVKKRMRLD
jgi:DNA-binding transcriptional LysR family regulator